MSVDRVDRDYIGFSSLPEQVHRKSVKKGFDFTLMVVGEMGLGKSTLINSLFLTDLYKDRKIKPVEERITATTKIERLTMDIEEKGVKLRLNVVDTPGFGDSLNCEDTWAACCKYIEEQFRQYFSDENGLNRKHLVDNRVHCCLYFIPPYGNGLRPIDAELMKRMQHKVNIIPVIGKADALTEVEVRKLKRNIIADIERYDIKTYQFPECDSDEDEDFKKQDRELKESVPFALVGSQQIIEIGDQKIRGRQYPWGIVEVENSKHSDFCKLRNFLITTHMQDLKEVTEDVHYENYRVKCISKINQHQREKSRQKRDSLSSAEGAPINVEKAATKKIATISETDRLLLQKDEELRKMQTMLAQLEEKLKASKSTGNIYQASHTPPELSLKRRESSVINV